MRSLTYILLPPLAVFALAADLGAREIKKDFHETFDVSRGMRLRIQHGDGDVDIQSWDKDVVDIEVHYHADVTAVGWGSRDSDFTVDFSHRGDLVSVTGRELGRRGFRIGFFSSHRYEYTYTVRGPAYLRLELEGDDGDIRIADWEGDLECELDDGDVLLENYRAERLSLELDDGDFEARGLEGELFLTMDDGDVLLQDCRISWGRLRMEDGDLEVERCEGNFDIVMDDGDIHLRSLLAKELDVRSEDGDIYVDLLRGVPPDVTLETDDGRVELDFEVGLSAEFIITTDDGRISLDIPTGSEIEKEPERATGVLGRGEGRIRIRTSDGNVSLRERSSPIREAVD